MTGKKINEKAVDWKIINPSQILTTENKKTHEAPFIKLPISRPFFAPDVLPRVSLPFFLNPASFIKIRLLPLHQFLVVFSLT